jgi:hypothetical protein
MAIVVAFTGMWPGDVVLDGPGLSLYVRLALDHWRRGDGIPALLPELWAGTPAVRCS